MGIPVCPPSGTPSKRPSLSPQPDALRELCREWRDRRQIDTDATHAVRVGCAEQLEEILDRDDP